MSGISFTNGDILRYDGSWSMYFDGSDVGLKALRGFTLLPDNTLLLAPGAAANLAQVGALKPQDIVRFTPTSLGNNTAGTFQMRVLFGVRCASPPT